MISHAKISHHRRMFKTLTGLSMEGFKQILPFHHRRSGAPYPARSRLWIPSPVRSSLKARFTASAEQPRDQGSFTNRLVGEWTYILGLAAGGCRGTGVLEKGRGLVLGKTKSDVDAAFIQVVVAVVGRRTHTPRFVAPRTTVNRVI